MKHRFIRAIALIFVLALVVSLASSLGAGVPFVQKSYHPSGPTHGKLEPR